MESEISNKYFIMNKKINYYKKKKKITPACQVLGSHFFNFFFFFFFFPFSILADVPFNPDSDDAQDVESFRLG